MSRRVDHFVRYRVDENGCWIWAGPIDRYGYGRMTAGVLAHRAFYERHIGAPGDGLVLDHLCRVRACVNPAHLEPVTNRVNLIRAGVYAEPGKCRKGHVLAEVGSYFDPTSGRSRCSECRRAYGRTHPGTSRTTPDRKRAYQDRNGRGMYKRRPWTAGEDLAVLERNAPDPVLSVRLKRSAASIQYRRWVLTRGAAPLTTETEAA